MTASATSGPFDLSVVIPAYNEEGHLGEQLDALAAQSWPGHRFEVLVVDNRSTDRTVEVAMSYADRFDGLRVLPARDQQGLSYTRNTGIDAAESSRIAICDADDIVAPGWVAAIGDALKTHRLVAGILEVDRLNPPWLAASRGRPATGPGPRFQGHFHVASGGNLGLHRDLWEEVGGFTDDAPGAEDIFFSMAAWRAGVEVHVVSDAVLHYRYRQDATSLWRQGLTYGSGRAAVSAELRRNGHATNRFSGWRSWVWLITSVPAVRTREGRMRWLWVLANRVGQLRGSLAERSLHI